MIRRLMMLAVAVVAIALIAGTSNADAQAPTPTPRPPTLTVEFACPDVPWSCLNTQTATKWQLYEVFCNQNDVCRFKHMQQVNSGDAMQLKSFAQWRLFMGPESDTTNKIMDCSPYLNQAQGLTNFEIYAACTRFPNLCAGPKHWQLYTCRDDPDGNCKWVYEGEFDKDCQYHSLKVSSGEHVKIHWGEPFELMPTVTPSVTPQPTRTRTATSTRGPATGTPTRTPTRTPTSTRTRQPATEVVPTATPPGLDFRLALPRLARP